MNTNSDKPRIIKDYDKLEREMREQIKFLFPEGFSENLIYFTNKEGKKVSALPFETDEKYYLIKMTTIQANQIIEDDEDYDMDGSLKEDVKEEYGSKYSDIDYISDFSTENEDLDEEDDD